MSLDVVACETPEQIVPAISPVFHYFGFSPGPLDASRFVPFIEPSRVFSVRDGDATVGGCASFPLEQTVPGGGTVRAAGLSVVGVLPTHRRRGILRRMMRAQLDDTHRRGEPIATLWASEDSIYGQFGYGLASLCGDMDLAKSATAFVGDVPARGELRLVGEAEAVAPMAEVYERARREHPGSIVRSAEWWRNRRLADPEHRRQGSGELNRVVLAIDGRPSAYALYRVHQQFETGASTGFLQVLEAVGDGPEATRAIWRFLLDIDWVVRVKAILLPVDHPLVFLLARPREMKFRVYSALWVRIVDVAAALAARPLRSGDPVVVEIADAFCPWNAGRWRIGPGGAERTSAAAELACDVTALGSAYFGGFGFRQLAAAGRVAERRDGALARADALCAGDRAPWCPEIF